MMVREDVLDLNQNGMEVRRKAAESRRELLALPASGLTDAKQELE
jgi:hypothetical protein